LKFKCQSDGIGFSDIKSSIALKLLGDQGIGEWSSLNPIKLENGGNHRIFGGRKFIGNKGWNNDSLVDGL
jgi:hypothetical protein